MDADMSEEPSVIRGVFLLGIILTLGVLWLMHASLDNSGNTRSIYNHRLSQVIVQNHQMTTTQIQLINSKGNIEDNNEDDGKNTDLDDTCPIFQLMPNKNTSDEVYCKRADFAPGSCRLMKTIFREKPANCSHQPTHIICEAKVSNPEKPYVLCHHNICKKSSYVSIGLYMPETGQYSWHKLNTTKELETFINCELLMDYPATYPNNGFCVIRCTNDAGAYVSQLLILPPVLHIASKQSKIIHSNGQLLNINILLLDSVSRHHFYRSLPKTVQKFRDLNEKLFKSGHVFDYELFQGIKGRTLESLQALFSGYKDLLPVFEALQVPQSTVDMNETFGKFKAYGYETVYVEDLCWLYEWGLVKELGALNLSIPLLERAKLFNEALGRVGIDRIDVTYSSCLILQENGVKNTFHGPTSVCYNGIHQHTYLLQYMEYFMSRFSSLHRPTFTFMMLDTAHEDTGIRIKQMDEYLARHVSFLAHQPNTVSFILSDHGNTYGRFLSASPESHVEIFHPTLFVIVPDIASKILGVTKLKALLVNQNRLVSLIDVHYTVVHMLPSSNHTHGKQSRFNFNSDGLLSPVSPLRKCKDVPRLHPNMCICQGSYIMENNSSYYALFAEFALSCINSMIVKQQRHTRGSCLMLTATRFSDVKISIEEGVGDTTIFLDLYVISSYSTGNEEERFTVTMLFGSTIKREGILFLGYSRLTPFSIYKKCADPTVDLQICICDRFPVHGNRFDNDNASESVLWTKTYRTLVHEPCLFLKTRNYTQGVVLAISNICSDRFYSIQFNFFSINLTSSNKMPVKRIVKYKMESLLVVGVRKQENLPWKYRYTLRFKTFKDKKM